MVTFTINIPPMLAYIPYMDPMGHDLLPSNYYPQEGHFDHLWPVGHGPAAGSVGALGDLGDTKMRIPTLVKHHWLNYHLGPHSPILFPHYIITYIYIYIYYIHIYICIPIKSHEFNFHSISVQSPFRSDQVNNPIKYPLNQSYYINPISIYIAKYLLRKCLGYNLL